MLVIEDDAAISRLVRVVLLGAGFEVAQAEDGETGIVRAREDRFDAILLDLTLPGMPGPEALQMLQRQAPQPIIILTASDAEDTLTRCVQAGAFDVARKPFDPEDLTLCVQLAVGEHPEHQKQPHAVKSGDLLLDFDSYRLSSQYAHPGATTQLSLSEWRILEKLASTPGQMVLYQEILGRVWGPSFRAHVHFLQAWMERLSKKVPLSEFQGVGYALVV